MSDETKCSVQGCVRVGEHETHVSEFASEATGLLPTRRRREHDYGKEYIGMFGSWVAYCVRPGCKAHRMKDRNRKYTCFYQHHHDLPTDEPGPCEVEP